MKRGKELLAQCKARFRALGVADEVIDSLTEAEVLEAHDGPWVRAYCHKCEREHRVSASYVAETGKSVDKDGFVYVKCGGCYL